jgi:hypothetical protein
LFAEREFRLLSPLAPGRTLEISDLRGRLHRGGRAGVVRNVRGEVPFRPARGLGRWRLAEAVVEYELRRLSIVLVVPRANVQCPSCGYRSSGSSRRPSRDRVRRLRRRRAIALAVRRVRDHSHTTGDDATSPRPRGHLAHGVGVIATPRILRRRARGATYRGRRTP